MCCAPVKAHHRIHIHRRCETVRILFGIRRFMVQMNTMRITVFQLSSMIHWLTMYTDERLIVQYFSSTTCFPLGLVFWRFSGGNANLVKIKFHWMIESTIIKYRSKLFFFALIVWPSLNVSSLPAVIIFERFRSKITILKRKSMSYWKIYLFL